MHSVFSTFSTAFGADLYCKKAQHYTFTPSLTNPIQYLSTLSSPPLLRSDIRLVRWRIRRTEALYYLHDSGVRKKTYLQSEWKTNTDNIHRIISQRKTVNNAIMTRTCGNRFRHERCFYVPIPKQSTIKKKPRAF